MEKPVAEDSILNDILKGLKDVLCILCTIAQFKAEIVHSECQIWELQMVCTHSKGFRKLFTYLCFVVQKAIVSFLFCLWIFKIPTIFLYISCFIIYKTFHKKWHHSRKKSFSIDLNMHNTRKQFLPIPLDWMGKKLILCHLYFKEKSLPKAFLVPSLHQSLPLHNRSVTLTLHLRQRKAKKVVIWH